MNQSILLKAISWVIAILGILTFSFSEEKSAMVDFGLVILVITTVIAIVFSLFNIIKRPALLKKVMMGVGILLVVLVISYFMTDDGAVVNSAGNQLIEAGSTSKWVGTGILYSIILLTVGAALFLFDMVKNLVK